MTSGATWRVKVLQTRHRDDPDVVGRFVEEARIGGQLQHPGVVPVHELGTLADRRPYFTMKLVKGRTLAALLNERAWGVSIYMWRRVQPITIAARATVLSLARTEARTPRLTIYLAS